MKKFLLSLLLTAVPGLTLAATCSVYSPVTGVMVGSSTSCAATAAVAADVTGLYSGTPTGVKFLRDDGTLAVPAGAGTVTTSGTPANGNLAKFSGATAITNGDLSGDCTTSSSLATVCLATNGVTFAASATTDTTNATNISSGTLGAARLPANGATPTASVGLTAVAGSATTWVRSDGAPALDQTIAPTMTGTWSFTNALAVTISSATPREVLNVTGLGADLGKWDFAPSSTAFLGRTRTDADGAGVNWIAVTRGTTTAISDISLGNATNNPTYNLLGSGALTVGGAGTYSSFLRINSSNPQFVWNETDVSTDLKRWMADANASIWTLRTLNDSGAGGTNAISVTRGATTVVSDIGLGNATDNTTLHQLGTGTVTFSSNTINATSATVTQKALIGGGTKFTASGCSNGTTVGGATAGSYNSGTSGTCTVVITLPTAPNGWVCAASNVTTAVDVSQPMTASTTTSCTISGTTVSGDVIKFMAIGY